MNLQHPRRQLLMLVEGRLEPAGRAHVEQHVAGCDICQGEVAELTQVADTLGALPIALRGLTGRQAGSWPGVWARIQGVPVRRMAPQLHLYLSLAVMVFVLAAALPAGLGNEPVYVTAGAIQTPVAAQVTPNAAKASASGAGQVSTARAASSQATGARAIPIPTPVPGLKS